MSTTKSITVNCDHSGCGSTSTGIMSTPASSERLGTARDTAAQLGWTRKGALDFCPLHEADAREDQS